MALPRRAFRPLLVSLICACACACGSTTPPPSPTRPDLFRGVVQVRCDVNPLVCTATVVPEGDVTARAVWSAADSFSAVGDQPVRSTEAVVFRTPGIPTVTAPHEFYIRADYDGSSGHSNAIAPHAYALAPDGAATPLAYVSGTVRSAAIGPLGSATVDVIAGEGRGKTSLTIENGFYLIEFLRLGQPFTMRASKPGYSSETRAVPGLFDDASGLPIRGAIDFDLAPAK